MFPFKFCHLFEWDDNHNYFVISMEKKKSSTGLFNTSLGWDILNWKQWLCVCVSIQFKLISFKISIASQPIVMTWTKTEKFVKLVFDVKCDSALHTIQSNCITINYVNSLWIHFGLVCSVTNCSFKKMNSVFRLIPGSGYCVADNSKLFETIWFFFYFIHFNWITFVHIILF